MIIKKKKKKRKREALLKAKFLNPKQTTSRNHIIQDQDMEKILQVEREKKYLRCRDRTIILATNLSAQIQEARRKWNDIFTILEDKNFQLCCYPAKISSNYGGETVKFLNMQKLKEFTTSKPSLQELLKEENFWTVNLNIHLKANNHCGSFLRPFNNTDIDS